MGSIWSYQPYILPIDMFMYFSQLFLLTGMSSVDRKANGKIGLRAFSYYMATTVIAAFTGIALAVLIQPGNSSRKTPVSSSGKVEAVHSVDSFLDLIRCWHFFKCQDEVKY